MYVERRLETVQLRLIIKRIHGLRSTFGTRTDDARRQEGRKEGRKEGAKAPLSNEKKNKGAVSHRFVREEGGKRLVGGKVCWRLRYSFIRTLIKATFEVQ